MNTVFLSHLLLVAVLLLSFKQHTDAAPNADAAKKAAEECIKEGGLNAEDTKRIMANELFSPKYETASDKLQCFLLCYYKKIGIIDAIGKQKADVFMGYLEHRFSDKKDKIKPALAKCSTVKATNPCEAVYAFEECVLKNIN